MNEPQNKTATSGRDASGRLLPGHTANPGGRPSLPDEFKAKGPAMFMRMAEIAEDAQHKHHFEALRWCLERLAGKATQVVDLGGDGAFEDFMRRVLTGGGKIDLDKDAPPSAGAKK